MKRLFIHAAMVAFCLACFAGAALLILSIFPSPDLTHGTMRLDERRGGCYNVYIENNAGHWELRGKLCGDLDGQ